jgi:hypothetical protein
MRGRGGRRGDSQDFLDESSAAASGLFKRIYKPEAHSSLTEQDRTKNQRFYRTREKKSGRKEFQDIEF